MKIDQLCQNYPQLTKEQLIKLRKLHNSIKGRCSSTHPNLKNYHDVKFEFESVFEFIDWILLEKSKGRDYFTMTSPHVARLFDSGNYRADNCIIKTATANVREATAKNFKIYDSLTGKTSFFISLRLFYNKNKHVLNCSLSTFYRLVNNSRLIEVSNDTVTGFIKIDVLD
ncbi:hypothetical protein P3573_13295 [Vibrio parahaemolyticus]|nr:hypothetical protein [Vibrio parahaemolyticus]MDF4278973.1 hypothetical protein [Vibrio parahaemolyticus]MDF4969552.1 hypothetical protein [Vibrio parahaemolyticus]MDG2548376.1 hypothetical protein [Vibrio parahaemolyticus]MDG2558395.1 hypothetical protein [Vibrio parahaemolyticus]